jgi:hypothetical protein
MVQQALFVSWLIIVIGLVRPREMDGVAALEWLR